MFQKLTILGNLGQDPEMRYTPANKAVTNFSVATSRKWSNGDGEQQEETVWFRVSVWDKQAESCNKYLNKGSQVLCEGRLTVDKESGGPRVWKDSSGNYRASYEMSANTVKFLGGKSEERTQEGNGMDEPEIPF